jgi:periplasmic copper chaperone A
MRDARHALAATLAALTLVVAACGDDAGHGTVTVSDVWSRASAASQLTGVVYFDIAAGDSGDALLSVSVPSDISTSAEIHETVAVDTTTTMSHDMGGSTMGGHDMGGAMTMQRVSSVHIPAGETVSFEPGGYHVMLMGLIEPLQVGQTFEVTLTFEHAGEIVVTAEVRE